MISGNMKDDPALEKAILGGGCFWCTEAVFTQVKGVHRVTPGYSGGITENPSYEAVCSGETGHAEVIEILFDPSLVSYGQLLEIFFRSHDPTSLNRQGADIGTQYRSVLYYTTPEQEKTAQTLIERFDNEGIFSSPIVTEIKAFDRFFPAEAYHHQYFSRNKGKPYCQIVIQPKWNKFRKDFPDLLK